MNNSPLTYRDEITDDNTDESNEAYISVLYNSIGTEVVVPWKDSIPVLENINKRKHNNQVNTKGGEDANHFLDSRVYELEFPDGCVE